MLSRMQWIEEYVKADKCSKHICKGNCECCDFATDYDLVTLADEAFKIFAMDVRVDNEWEGI